MKTLFAPTEDFIKGERGRLSVEIGAGTSVAIPVVSGQGVNIDDYLVVGFEGNELAEICKVTAVGASSITVATLKFNHGTGEPFVVYRFNQRKFYGALTSGGAYTELTADGSPKDISVDDPQGTVLEYSGADYAYFKATYYNSTTQEESAISDSEAVSANESARYVPLYAIRKHAGLAGNPRYSDLNIERKRKQAENEINSTLAAEYVLPLTEVPGIISYICELLAAGYIDYEEFGKDGEGVKWLGEARALLKSIQKGTQLLIGVDGIQLTRTASTGVLDGNPSNVDTDKAKFSMDMRF